MRICIHSFPQMGWKFFSAESTPLVIQQSPVTLQVIVYVVTLYFICLFIFLFLLLFFLLVLYFQISDLEPFFTDTVFRFSFHDSVSGFRIARLVFVLKAVVKFYFLWL